MLYLEFQTARPLSPVHRARLTYVDGASGLHVPAELSFTVPFGVRGALRDGRPPLIVRHWADIAARACGIKALGTSDFYHVLHEIDGAEYDW